MSKEAYFAGGCFWCVESDLEKIPAVESVVSGYAGGTGRNPTYDNHKDHREAVKVVYDPSVTSFEDLVWHFFRHIDPTDPGGSFYDRGHAYTSAVYYQTDEEREIVERVIKEIDASGRFEKPIVTTVEAFTNFYTAEEYHQNYHTENAAHYNMYRTASGRDAFINKHWGDDSVSDGSPTDEPTN